MSPTPLRIRISWSPGASSLRIEELAFGGQILLAGVERQGGHYEATLPQAVRAPLLRWQLCEGKGARGAEPLDEIRIEVRDAGGAWHLIGELLGGGGSWRGERLVGALLRTAGAPEHRLACAL